ncbi:MAG TPA: hypothetical protein VLG37_04320 [Candidatus Saccharimonadales bacterium]|nr:hypothetical protein [Candidatus Saccharimonadales bacterium]HSX46745.1 hypothetical protein [Patescibacteria group bacterium]
MGHEPQTMTVEAMDDDEAMEKMMAMQKAHLAEKHSDMPMTDDQVREHIMSHWTKS